MSNAQTLQQTVDQVVANPVLLDLQTTVPICEGMNVTLASCQALALQYQKHHVVVQGTECYQLHSIFMSWASD